jgi:hypothetical protein
VFLKKRIFFNSAQALFRQILSVGVQSRRPNLTVRKDSLNYVSLLDSTSMEQEIVFLHVCVLCAACVKKLNAKDAIVATVKKNLNPDEVTRVYLTRETRVR